MTVRLSRPGQFRDLSQVDLKHDSTVRFDKVIAPASGPCGPSRYVVAETISDDFNRPNGPGFQSPFWREIQSTIPSPHTAVSINANELVEAFGVTLNTCVGGIREDFTQPSSNWRVTGVWGSQDARAPGSNGPRMFLCGPISQVNPLDPAPPITQVRFFGWVCEHSLTTPATYNFNLLAYSAGVLTLLGTAFTTTAFGTGHTYALEVFCNNVSTGPSSTILRGLVDGAIVRTSAPNAVGNLPAGLPGCGIMYEQGLGTPANVVSLNSWTAERLV